MSTTTSPQKFTFVPTECMLCGGTESSARYTIQKHIQGDLHYVTCSICGTAYQNPMPDNESMRAFYHSQSFFNSKASGELLTGYRDYDAEDYTRRVNAKRRLREVESLFPKNQSLKILKVACGYGALVRLARDRGHDAQGIDYSEVMVRGARESYDIDIIHDDFLEHDFGDERFDAILLYGAINNFLRPLDVAARVRSLLRPGGYYVVNHVWLNSMPEKLLRHRYWIYRPPIVGLYPRREFERRHCQLGYEVHRSIYDFQYLTMDKFFGYLQFRPLIRAVEALRVSRLGFSMPIPGYARVFFKKIESNDGA